MIKNLIKHLAQVLKSFHLVASIIYTVLLIIEKIKNLGLLIFYFTLKSEWTPAGSKNLSLVLESGCSYHLHRGEHLGIFYYQRLIENGKPQIIIITSGMAAMWLL